MNGFANTLFSLLLGWLRTLVSSVWNVLSSEEGNVILAFLRAYWLQIAVALCAGGLAVDAVVYLLRWRPYYVWSTNLNRFKRRVRGEKEESEPDHPHLPYMPPQPSAPQSSDAPYADPVYEPAPYAPVPPPMDSGTQVYAPIEPLYENPTQGLTPGFGAPQPEPPTYLQDVQAGFAPPPPPQELYAPHPAPQGPIHPGLDLETFQQNIGLTGAQTPLEEPAPRPAAPPVFVPSFYQETPEPQRARGGLSALAQKARTLMGTPSDDEHQPTIRDLQTTVDFKTAFHAPVLPKRAERHEEE